MLTLKRAIPTGLRNMGCAVAQVGGRRLLLATGEQWDAAMRPCLMALDDAGDVVWRDDFPEEPGALCMGAQPHVLHLDDCVAVGHFVAHRQSGSEGLFRLLAVDTGLELWRAGSGTIYGGNRDVHCADLDGDGEPELLVGYADRLACYGARDGACRWVRSDGVRICWGRCAIGDINADGRLEIVLGTEYGNPDGTSSILALRADGSLLWEYGGIEGDCGSTPGYLADVDSDGRPEVLKTEIDLEHRGPVHRSRLWCLTADGVLRWVADLGGGDITWGDFTGDGTLAAVAVTSGRDGGDVSPGIRCVGLRDGRLRWELPLARHWLSGWSTAFDTDGDGVLDAVLPHGSPSGYGRQPGAGPWGEVLVVTGDGRLLQRLELPDWPVHALTCDWDADGADELLVACGDGRVYVYGT